MKKIITIILLAAIGLAVQANPIEYQGDRTPKKLVEKALKNGVSSMGTYTINNKSNEKANPSEVIDYLRRNGYIVISSSEKRHSRFGEKITIIDRVEFTDKSNFQRYAFLRLRGNRGLELNRMKPGGKFYRRTCHDVGFLIVVTGQKCKAEFIRDVYWTGSFVNGFLNGKGTGYAQVDGEWALFEGEFQAGFPVKSVTLRKISTDLKISEMEVQSLSLAEIITMKSNARNDTLAAVTEYAKLRYAEDVRQLMEEYQKASSLLNKEDYDKSYKCPLFDWFVGLYDGLAGVDVQNVLSKAHELVDIYSITEAFWWGNRIEGALNNYDGTVFDFYYEWNEKSRPKWDGKKVVYIQGLIDQAKNIIQTRSKDTRCGFHTFYNSSVFLYLCLDVELNNKSVLDRSKRKYDMIVDAYNKQDSERRASSSSYAFSSSSSSPSSSSTESSSSEVTESRSESSSSSTKRTFSCKVELVLPDGGHVVGRNVECWIHRGKWTDEGGYVKCWIDDNGKGTIEWEESRGDYIEKIVNICQFGKCYHVDDVELKPGGNYKLKAVEN